MNGDIIKCTTCGKEFVDQTTQKLQDSRRGIFINRCPYCYSIYTINTNKKAIRKTKFKYLGVNIRRRDTTHSKSKDIIKKPNLHTKVVAREILGYRQNMHIEEISISPSRTRPESEHIKDSDWYSRRGITFDTSMKPYTPQELKQQEINNRIEEMKSPSNNYKKYKGWWRYVNK